MTQHLDYKGRDVHPSVESVIKQFLNSIGHPQTFGEINKYLKEKNIQYKNSDKDRSGLAHTLNRMIEHNQIKKIPKDDFNNYPKYITIEKSTFDASFEGYLMRTELTSFLYKPLPYSRGDQDIEDIFKRKKKFSLQERKIQKLITFLGLQIIFSVVTGYERPINRTKTTKINKTNLDSWLKNALAFHDPLEPIGEIVSELLSGDDTSDLKKTMKDMYPHIIGRMESSQIDFDEIKNDLREGYLRRRDYAARMRE